LLTWMRGWTASDTRMVGLASEVRALRDEMREEICGLRYGIRELADLIRERELPGPSTQ